MERNKRTIGWINGWSKREGRMRETAWNEWVSGGGSTGFSWCSLILTSTYGLAHVQQFNYPRKKVDDWNEKCEFSCFQNS